MLTRPIRLIAIDIDGTLLDSKFQVSQANLDALRRAHEVGHRSIVLGTGRRHQFALPIAESLGFDLWSSARMAPSPARPRGELFHQDLLPQATAIQLCRHMREFRNYMVITFDREGMGAIVCENHEHLYGVIQRWMEKNAPFIEYVSPIEKALTEDPIQAMFCGPVELMQTAQQRLADLRLRRRDHRPADAVRSSRPVHRRHFECGLLEGPCAGALGHPSRHRPLPGDGDRG